MGQSLLDIERSIITRYRRKIWRNFVRATREFDLIREGDRIAVAISGGKDSLLMAKLLQELQRHGKDNFQLEFIAMDPGYDENTKEILVTNSEYLGIPINIFTTNIFQVAEKIGKGNPCYMCAKMRRGALYGKAEELGCNKLALGHHFNDVIETIMLNLLYTGNFSTMLPKIESQNFENLKLIRPLYYIEEITIIDFFQYIGLSPLNCACTITGNKVESKRSEMKKLIKDLGKDIKDVDKIIFRASKNVNMNGILGWRKDGERYSYLDK